MKKVVVRWIFIIICVVILVIDLVGFWKYKLKGTKYQVATSADTANDTAIEENTEPEIDYEELTNKDFSDGEKLFITNINKDENEEDKYIIKGLIYEKYEFSKEEYNNEEVTVMKKWNPEKVNVILKNENYTGTLLQGKRRKLY